MLLPWLDRSINTRISQGQSHVYCVCVCVCVLNKECSEGMLKQISHPIKRGHQLGEIFIVPLGCKRPQVVL